MGCELLSGAIGLLLSGAGVVVAGGSVGAVRLLLPGVVGGWVGAGRVVFPGAGVGSGVAPGAGRVFPGAGAGVVVAGLSLGAGVVLPAAGVVVSGVPVVDGVVLSVGLVSTVVLPEPLDELALLPEQRELRGKRSHRILNASGDSLISVGELLDESLAWAIWDLLD